MKKKFYIVPSTKTYYDTVESESKKDALVDFATGMCNDMAAYFEATDEAPVTYPHEYEFGSSDYEVAMSIVVSSLMTHNNKSVYYIKDFNADGKDIDLRHMDTIIRLQDAYDTAMGCLRKGNLADHLKIVKTQKRFYKLFQAITGFMFDGATYRRKGAHAMRVNEKSPKEKAIRAMQNMRSVAGIMYNDVRNGSVLTPEEIGTYINGLEFCIRDISEHYGYDSILAKQVNERYAELKSANAKISELQAELRRKDVGSDTVTAKLSLYEDTARAFYEAAGFHYGTVSFTARALVIEMSAEYHREPEPHLTTAKDMFNKLRKRMEAKQLVGFELIQESSYREYIKDTERNRRHIADLYKVFMPDFRITEFRSTQVKCEWTCRYSVYLPYTDIENLINKYGTDKEATSC